jgi:hypothetical protein
VTYAGGGAGGNRYGSTSTGTGGTGGGGSAGSAGSANTGGGGSAGYPGSTAGKAGGSGIVIVRARRAAVSTTGSPTVTTGIAGGWTAYTFTSSGSITW